MGDDNNFINMHNLIPRMPEIPTPSLVKTNPAAWTYERLAEYFKDFEGKLDQDHEIGARLVSFGRDVVFHIVNMGYYGPDIITFSGINENEEEVKLIQNISQLNILLIAMKKLKEKPFRIGFLLDDESSMKSE